MKTPSLNNVDAWNADVVAGAVKFTATLFLGAGKYTEELSATTAEEIRDLAKLIKEEHADNNRDVIIYAFDADGNKSLVSGTPYKSGSNKTTIGSPLADQIRAAEEAANAGELEPEITDLPLMNLAAKPTLVDLGNLPTAQTETAAPKAAKPARAAKPAKEKPAAAEKPAKLTAEEKEAAKVKAKADKEAAKAAAKAAKETEAKPLSAKEQAAADAAAGILPLAPDFSKDTHKPFRKKLAAIVAMIEANDIASLKAETTEPKSSSRVILCRYRDLAIAALEARNASKEA